ncbi:MAG: serine/threonine protein kinase [Proteobacteria bacterium]|nr:serine/threonine protein kinase [Pseudomonadota bacterium]
MPDAQENKPLPKDFQLEAYRIERQISEGGFSFVYLARDEAGTAVAIKEYLPSRLIQRLGEDPAPIVPEENRTAFNRGMKSFFEEGRILARVKHPNVVQVLNFFRANETAYMVMRYEEGISLAEHLLAMYKKGRNFDEDTLRALFVRLLSGLREVHLQKLLHLDIKPANIYLRKGGQPVLLDFGASRQGLGEGDPTLTQVHTPGFAAPEQQGSGEALGPWTDIYSIGATLYACLAVDTPQAAKDRLQKDELEPAEKRWFKIYSPVLLEIIDWSMKLHVHERPQSVFEIQKVLSGELLDLVDPAWFD